MGTDFYFVHKTCLRSVKDSYTLPFFEGLLTEWRNWLSRKHNFNRLINNLKVHVKKKLYLFYNNYETIYTTYINHARWHGCTTSNITNQPN